MFPTGWELHSTPRAAQEVFGVVGGECGQRGEREELEEKFKHGKKWEAED